MVYKSFLKQVAPLLISLALVGGLSLLVREFGKQAPEPFEGLVVEALPEIPDLQGWPEAFIERLSEAHGRLQKRETRDGALVELAQLYHANGFVSQAESCYLGLEAYQPEAAEWPYLLAALKEDYRDKTAVIANLQRSLRLDPTYSLGYRRLGEAYVDSGQIEEARAAFARRLEAAPEDAWALAGMGRAALFAGDWAEAERWLLQALEAEERLALPYELLPELYHEIGDIEAAKRFRELGRERAVIYWKEDPRLSFLETRCYSPLQLIEFARRRQALGEYGAAVELLQRAWNLDPSDSEALERLQEIAGELE